MAAIWVPFICSAAVMLVVLLFIPLVLIVITFNLWITLDGPLLSPSVFSFVVVYGLFVLFHRCCWLLC